jgi:hypothetical protein
MFPEVLSDLWDHLGVGSRCCQLSPRRHKIVDIVPRATFRSLFDLILVGFPGIDHIVAKSINLDWVLGLILEHSIAALCSRFHLR